MKCLGLFHVTKQARHGVQSSVDYIKLVLEIMLRHGLIMLTLIIFDFSHPHPIP